MRFVEFAEVAAVFSGKRVAIVGSAPSCLGNEPGFVDGHDVVVRVNNYKTGVRQGKRTDVHYSFYGTSIRTRAETLRADGVRLCMAKCPNAKALDSDWHELHNKPEGVDYRYIYRYRSAWWFCDTFVPDVARYLAKFELLDKHIPTTGFAAILDVLDAHPASLYLTGFDFFSSKIHNVDEPWKPGDPHDPICHRPDLEATWLVENTHRFPLRLDAKLQELMNCVVPA